MDSAQYKREVERLERETSALTSVDDSAEVAEAPTGKFATVMKYKSYIFILLGVLVLLYLIKPKYILKISTDNDDKTPVMVVDVKKFLICWIVLSLLISAIYFITKKMKKAD